jgi:hypothetical protein
MVVMVMGGCMLNDMAGAHFLFGHICKLVVEKFGKKKRSGLPI